MIENFLLFCLDVFLSFFDAKKCTGLSILVSTSIDGNTESLFSLPALVQILLGVVRTSQFFVLNECHFINFFILELNLKFTISRGFSCS